MTEFYHLIILSFDLIVKEFTMYLYHFHASQIASKLKIRDCSGFSRRCDYRGPRGVCVSYLADSIVIQKILLITCLVTTAVETSEGSRII